MKQKGVFLIGIILSGISGWILGFLRLPYLEKNFSFFLGFIACLSLICLGYFFFLIWKKEENSLHKNNTSKYSYLSFLVFSFILIGGWTSSFLFLKQNKFAKIQNQQLNKKTAEEFELIATNRKNNSLILMNNLFDKIDVALKNNPNGILSDTLIEQIAALNYSFKPYQYFDGEKFSEKKWSPERGQLLLMLAKMKLDSSSFNQIKLKVSFLGADLKNADLAGADLSNTDLREANLDNANLANANLNKVILEKAFLQKANLSRANLKHANLKYSNMQWTEFHAAKLNGAQLNGAILSNAKLREVDLSKADLRWANLKNVFLNKANLANANLIETDLSQANLEKVNFTEANLATTVLNGANLNQANLTNANVIAAKIEAKNWLEKLDTWQVIGAKVIQESYHVGNDALPNFKYKLHQIKK